MLISIEMISIFSLIDMWRYTTIHCVSALNWYGHGDVYRYTLCFAYLSHAICIKGCRRPAESPIPHPQSPLSSTPFWLFNTNHVYIWDALSRKSGVSFILGDWGLCARHPGIDNHSPLDNKWRPCHVPPAFCVEKVAVKRATCASNDPGNEIKKLKCVYTNRFPPPRYPKRMNDENLYLEQWTLGTIFLDSPCIKTGVYGVWIYMRKRFTQFSLNAN